MSGVSGDEAEKSHEPTPQKLQKAREKGDVAKSTDLLVAASYAGLLLAALAVGSGSVQAFCTGLMVLLDQPDQLAQLFFEGSSNAIVAGLVSTSAAALIPWFALPAALVLLSILAQRAFVVSVTKVQPKISRISLISNAKNKFGRSGFFEFFKSFTKLVIYSVCLALFLKARLTDIVSTADTSPLAAISLMARLCIEFLFLVLIVAACIGVVDALWQHQEHLRKNRMSRKEVTDENKESEGDPHIKQQRRQRGQEIALNQMMADVPEADVVIVNPTHYAVALKWSRSPGAAPVCVAKGVDEIAASIRKTATLASVPIHHDPPTARALHATVGLGQEIPEEHFGAVAAAIRFAEQMRIRAKGKIQ